MASTFFDRIDELSAQVGHGHLVGKNTVDQVYAAPQERGFWETGPLAGVVIHNHPGGGGTHFLRDSLYEPIDAHMAKLAARAITPDGSEIDHAMIDVVEDIAQGVFERAPVEFGDLRASAQTDVTKDGENIYHRPPNVPRLARDDLAGKVHARRLFPRLGRSR